MTDRIDDYRNYELSRRQLFIFCSAGYGVLFGVIWLFFHSLLLSLLSGALIWRFLPACCRHLARRRRRELLRQFRNLLYSLSSSVAAGRQMEEAILEAEESLSFLYGEDTPLMTELRHMGRSIRENNENDRRLLTDFARRSGCEDINSFVQVYLTCRSMGGDLARIIAHTSEVMAERMEIEEQIAVLTAQKKLEGRIISLMPLAMLLMLNLLSPSYIDVLYTTPAGHILMALCLGGIAAGVVWMEKLTDVEN
ncbi:MAG: type II secretion system F family protein [Bacillota bacterium]|nr:type II secretion system F family protein [Bacillota bacterium]